MTKTRRIAAVGVLAAVYCIAALIIIPFPLVPLTLQCFAVALGAFVFGAKEAVLALIVYISLGAAGVPVFSGVKGGVQILIGPTGGFIWGFFVFAIACGFCKGKTRWPTAVLCTLGLGLCYCIGVAQFAFVTGTVAAKTLFATFSPFFVKDLVFTAGAVYISASLNKAFSAQSRGKKAL